MWIATKAMRPTQQQFIEHLKTGIKTPPLSICLVCDKYLTGRWTDYNGEIRCGTCGMTYQIMGSHFKEEFLKEIGLQEKEVARNYCPDFYLVPIFREYWAQVGKRLPLGTYVSDRDDRTEDEVKSFKDWLCLNADRLQPLFPEDFQWDRIRT